MYLHVYGISHTIFSFLSTQCIISFVIENVIKSYRTPRRNMCVDFKIIHCTILAT